MAREVIGEGRRFRALGFLKAQRAQYSLTQEFKPRITPLSSIFLNERVLGLSGYPAALLNASFSGTLDRLC